MMANADYVKPWTLFWSAAAAGAGYLAVALVVRWRGWARGGASPAPPQEAARGRVAAIWLQEALAQRQLLQLSRLRRAAHLCTSWGFVALALLSLLRVVLMLASALGADGAGALLDAGGGRAFARAWGNGAGLVLLAGLLLSLGRRLRPHAETDGPAEGDLPLVTGLLALTVSGFLLEGLAILLPALSAQGAASLRPWLTALWTLHGIGGVALVAWLPHSGLLHALLAPLVIGLNARREHGRKDLYWPR